jgi:molybdenum cofactor guanylyltransferase
VLLLPCDLPKITAAEILRLVQSYRADPQRVAVACTTEGDHPLCAVVPANVQPAVTAAIAAGSHGVGRLWQSVGAASVTIDDDVRLLNINTPEDLHAWRNSSENDRSG